MVFRSKILTAALVAATALTASASFAADLDQVIYADDANFVKPAELGSSWYIRGDISAAVFSGGSADDYRTFDAVGGTYGDNAWNSSDISTDMSYSIGFGKYLRTNTRFDLTLDRFEGGFDGTTSADVPCPGGLVDTGCASNDSADFTAYSLMANLYQDFGNFHGFTPYVGAGIGVTHMEWGPLTNSLYCVDGVATCASYARTDIEHEGEKSWRVSAQLMAGASYDLTKNLKLDVGYRYRHVLGGDFFGFDAASEAAGASGVQGKDKGFHSHDVKVGMRYSFF